MANPDGIRYARIALNNGSGAIPALGFGTLIPDPVATRNATKAALEVGFRQLDASERYGNEKEVGEALQEVFKAGKIKREDVFIATKLWNNNHRPERPLGPLRSPLTINKTPQSDKTENRGRPSIDFYSNALSQSRRRKK